MKRLNRAVTSPAGKGVPAAITGIATKREVLDTNHFERVKIAQVEQEQF